jgi:Phosphatidate phosphatase APP1, catalytic domain
MVLRRAKRQSPAPEVVIFRWDLDKTYLKSEFESLRELMRIPFEKPEDKVSVPGVVPLIRGLRDVATQAGRDVRVYFISASPPQIAKAIREKLALDGIDYDGIVFKNQLHHLVRGKFRNLREQVGYKLTELLKSRAEMPPDSTEVLFGDDWESDPIIYSLYADVLANRLAADELDDVLETIGVDPKLSVQAKELAAAARHEDVVTRIYINLERRTPPAHFRLFGTRLVPAYNYFQTAVCLYEDGHLTLPAVAQVGEHLINTSGYTPERLANSLADIMRRGHLTQASTIAVREYLQARGVLPRRRPAGVRRSLWRRLLRWLRSEPLRRPASQGTINYQTLVAEWRGTR